MQPRRWLVDERHPSDRQAQTLAEQEQQQ